MDDRHQMTEPETALVGLAPRLAFPPTPDLAGAVRAEIAGSPVSARRRLIPSWRPALALATALAAVTLGVMTFSPATREAVADWIGLDGVRITFGDEPRARIAQDLALGESVTLEAAEERADFDVEVLGALGNPDEVYILEDRPGGRVALVYKAREGLPRTAETGVGALFSQFRATYRQDVAQKKMLDQDGIIQLVEVDDARGYWLGGGPHSIVYLDEEGEAHTDQVRLAGNTLLWQRDGIVFRLETALPRDEAIELAETAE